MLEAGKKNNNYKNELRLSQNLLTVLLMRVTSC